MMLDIKNLGLTVLLMMFMSPAVVSAEEGDKPCHHNLEMGQQQHHGGQPCDHEKSGHGHHKQGDEPCDHKKAEEAKHHAWRDSLSDQQAQQIDAMHEKLHQQQRELHDKISDRQQQTRQMVLVDTPDFTAIRVLVDEISSLRSELHLLHLQHITDMRKALTDEQRLQFDQDMRDTPHHHD